MSSLTCSRFHNKAITVQSLASHPFIKYMTPQYRPHLPTNLQDTYIEITCVRAARNKFRRFVVHPPLRRSERHRKNKHNNSAHIGSAYDPNYTPAGTWEWLRFARERNACFSCVCVCVCAQRCSAVRCDMILIGFIHTHWHHFRSSTRSTRGGAERAGT